MKGSLSNPLDWPPNSQPWWVATLVQTPQSELWGRNEQNYPNDFPPVEWIIHRALNHDVFKDWYTPDCIQYSFTRKLPEWSAVIALTTAWIRLNQHPDVTDRRVERWSHKTTTLLRQACWSTGNRSGLAPQKYVPSRECLQRYLDEMKEERVR